ncbi:GroES-like protein [Pseudovirgaria hyperparasitica]|uniref:GroES-like protein n=1 Tax=Pseudovirgaria hyperparasitica TaxID=470096 RepID=A0A6A6WJC6_9PEZI|nr:GroES-like protein [Pseudovirgaria hyperparasitica]KAF2762260.1 GroES-like protein [Pseudovirgaria hyperparasitica]
MTATVSVTAQKRAFDEIDDDRTLKHRRVGNVPNLQHQLLLHKKAQPFELHRAGDVPVAKPGEVLIEIQAVGLNPIDWKSALYGFAIPAFPCISGREFAGTVVYANGKNDSGIVVGDRVLSIATDYRDFRKSAFQQYAVSTAFNAVKIPRHVDLAHTTSLGVAFVAAALALGVCLGVNFAGPVTERSLLKTAQNQDPETLPKDVRDEVLNAISPSHTPYAGDWILIYGASSITGQICIQLCKLSNLRVIAVANESRHGERLRALGADLIVDREDLDKAATQIRESVPGSLRFAIDCVGKETAAWCQDLLAGQSALPAAELRRRSEDRGSDPSNQGYLMCHLVGLTGLPKEQAASVRQHQVPIKLFHENHALGREMSSWLTELLGQGLLQLPEVELLKGGLGSINAGLDRLKSGALSGKRLVVELDHMLESKLAVWPPEDGGFCWC